MRGKLALVLAIVLGLVAVLGFRQILRQKTESAEQKLKEVEILAAAEMIKPGTPLDPKLMAVKEWPEAAITDDNIMWGERLQYVNQTFTRPVERNAPILKSYFAHAAVEVGTTLPAGQVATTFRVDDVSGVAGTIRPGDHVDVIGTLPLPLKGGGGGDVTTERLLADCTVLAVDNRTALTDMGPSVYGRGGTNYSTITLALTPREAVILTYVQNQGKITFALRNRTDSATDEKEPPEIKLSNVRDEAAGANAERKAVEKSASSPLR